MCEIKVLSVDTKFLNLSGNATNENYNNSFDEFDWN